MRTLVVVHPHPYHGIRREAGTQYEAADFDAALLVQSGQARYRDESGAISEQTQTQNCVQTYHTRALTATTARRPRAKKVVTA